MLVLFCFRCCRRRRRCETGVQGFEGAARSGREGRGKEERERERLRGRVFFFLRRREMRAID